MFQEDQSASVKPKVYFTFYAYARDAYGVNFVIRTMCVYCTVMAKNIAPCNHEWVSYTSLLEFGD